MSNLKAFIEGLNKYYKEKGINIWFGYQYSLLPQKLKIFKEYKLRVKQVDGSNEESVPIDILEYSKILKIEDENKIDEIIDNEAPEIIASILEKVFDLKLSV